MSPIGEGEDLEEQLEALRLLRAFAALADPTRRPILARLASGEASVTELAGPFDISLPAISKHLKVLERAALVARRREMDPRPGGAFRLVMRSPEGRDHRLRGVFREIVEPERLVCTWAWEDADGKDGHETLLTVTFAERDGNRGS